MTARQPHARWSIPATAIVLAALAALISLFALLF